MNTFFRTATLLALGILSAGCLVRSIHPWLSDDSSVKEPALIGTWRDRKTKTSAAFSAEDGGYAIEVTDGQQKTSRLQASLHRVGETLLLQIAPSHPEGINAFALLPARILYKAHLDEDTLTLFPVDPESFELRAVNAGMPLLAEGSTHDGYVLTASSTAVESFLLDQIGEPGFFSETPHYTFRKVSASP
ncbi:MAG: hypothetical protein GX548_10815 [Lentisphaerae bacterium]|mgnify:CR=1 FL=1|nr:hypothetical protein [Lentisphaerota bacterium]